MTKRFFDQTSLGRREPSAAAAHAGFTLVEALISVVIFALGIAALMPMLVANVRSNDSAYIRSRAAALCQEKIEYYRSLTYQQILDDTLYGSEALDFNGNEVASGGFFARQSQRDDTLNPDGGDLKRISVGVSWTGKPGRPGGSVIFVTSRARY